MRVTEVSPSVTGKLGSSSQCLSRLRGISIDTEQNIVNTLNPGSPEVSLLIFNYHPREKASTAAPKYSGSLSEPARIDHSDYCEEDDQGSFEDVSN